MIIAIDLDGTLAQEGEWQGQHHIGEPFPGAVEFCRALVDGGHALILHTRRVAGDRDPRYDEGLSVSARADIVERWLLYHAFPPMGIWVQRGKPGADLFLDDRALRLEPARGTFVGSYDAALHGIGLLMWERERARLAAERAQDKLPGVEP